MNGGGIIDHQVGTGKTLIMCIAAFEMKRLGLANKPMIIGLKSNVHDIADTFRKMCIRDSANLVSTIRLPDNLFTDAGTEVGSDLIVLQKNTRKSELRCV